MKLKDTKFKKGNIPGNTRKVGDYRIAKDNILEIKVAHPNKWQSYHSYLWEKYHGEKVPKNKVIIFIDGNNRNFAKDNLAAVTRRELMLLNLLKMDKCETKLLIAKIKAKILDEREKYENLNRLK